METLTELLNKNKQLLKERDSSANKGSYGKLLVIGGSMGMTGAAYLVSLAAFRTGIGMVKIFGPECNRIILQVSIPEAMYAVSDRADGSIDTDELKSSIRWADYVIAGPGLSQDSYGVKIIKAMYSDEVREVLAEKKMVILDADALNNIAALGLKTGALCGNTVITPHVGEMSRLSGKSIAIIKETAAETAKSYSRENCVTVVLKDHSTAVAGAAGEYIINSGCGAMAKAGSGDVLCGFIAGTSAMLKGNTADAVPIAVWLHGRAGCIASENKGCHSVLAGDIADAAGEALKEL